MGLPVPRFQALGASLLGHSQGLLRLCFTRGAALEQVQEAVEALCQAAWKSVDYSRHARV